MKEVENKINSTFLTRSQYLENKTELTDEKINPGVKPRQDSAEEESSEQSVTFTGKAISLGSF